MASSSPPERWVPLSSIELGPEEIRLVEEAIHTGWVSSTGPNVLEFEKLLAKRAGRQYAVAVANGTLALELVLRALGIGPGDEVIVPALTFVAPAAVVATVGAHPVFVDVSPESWTLDPAGLAHARTPKTRAVIAVDVLGHPADYDAIASALPGIPVIEDAAEAHGATYRGRPVGSMGIAATFSFHANKTISTGEGGAVVSDDLGLVEHMRLLMNHGMTKERPYYHEVVGHNFRMTNVTAAIGVGQVNRWDELHSGPQSSGGEVRRGAWRSAGLVPAASCVVGKGVCVALRFGNRRGASSTSARDTSRSARRRSRHLASAVRPAPVRAELPR